MRRRDAGPSCTRSRSRGLSAAPCDLGASQGAWSTAAIPGLGQLLRLDAVGAQVTRDRVAERPSIAGSVVVAAATPSRAAPGSRSVGRGRAPAVEPADRTPAGPDWGDQVRDRRESSSSPRSARNRRRRSCGHVRRARLAGLPSAALLRLALLPGGGGGGEREKIWSREETRRRWGRWGEGYRSFAPLAGREVVGKGWGGAPVGGPRSKLISVSTSNPGHVERDEGQATRPEGVVAVAEVGEAGPANRFALTIVEPGCRAGAAG